MVIFCGLGRIASEERSLLSNVCLILCTGLSLHILPVEVREFRTICDSLTGEGISGSVTSCYELWNRLNVVNAGNEKYVILFLSSFARFARMISFLLITKAQLKPNCSPIVQLNF